MFREPVQTLDDNGTVLSENIEFLLALVSLYMSPTRISDNRVTTWRIEAREKARNLNKISDTKTFVGSKANRLGDSNVL